MLNNSNKIYQYSYIKILIDYNHLVFIGSGKKFCSEYLLQKSCLNKKHILSHFSTAPRGAGRLPAAPTLEPPTAWV